MASSVKISEMPFGIGKVLVNELYENQQLKVTLQDFKYLRSCVQKQCNLVF